METILKQSHIRSIYLLFYYILKGDILQINIIFILKESKAFSC